MTDIAALIAAHRAAAPARRTTFGLAERRAALARLAAALDVHQAVLIAAMRQDFARPEAESELLELLPLRQEIGHARRHLRRWTRTRRAAPGLLMLGTAARIRPEPRGVALIIAPWNYPVLLALGPVVSALAAGCSVILKPSELTPATTAAIAAMVGESFPPDLFAVVEGGSEVSTELLAQPFDHIFFTGSTAVGRIVMAAAAKTLASVTLELGGKSPVIVGPGADIAASARSLAWGKLANAGQTCVAPDHLYVHRSVAEPLTKALSAEIAHLYGPDPDRSPDYGRIVNDRHFARVTGLIDEALAQGARLIAGGKRDSGTRFVAPTLLADTTEAMKISQEEIFGPVMPVIPYDDLDEVIARINAGPRPLALYIYDRDRAFVRKITEATSSGTVGVNLSVVQFAHPNQPFGGIGASGQGAAHGEAGFLAFSHLKPVLTNRFSPLPLLFPPYRKRFRSLTRLMARLVR